MTASVSPPSPRRSTRGFGNYVPARSRLVSTDIYNESSFDDFTLAQADAIALQPPTGWPLVNTSDPKQAGYCDPRTPRPGDSGLCLAYRNISTQLTKGNPDLRSQYSDDLTRGTWDFTTLSYPANASFTQAEFKAVEDQLSTEVLYATQIGNLEAQVKNLKNDDQLTLDATLQGVYDDVTKSLQPDSGTKLSPKWQAVMSTAEALAGDAASFAGGPAGKAALDLGFGLINIASASANDPNGQALQAVEREFSELRDESVNDFIQAQAMIGNLFDLIYADGGRLTALGNTISVGQKINWDGSISSAVLKSMNLALRRHYFTALIGASFELGIWTNVGEGTPPDIGVLCDKYTYYYKEDADGTTRKVCDTPNSDRSNWVALPQSYAGDGKQGDRQNYDIRVIGTDVRCSANQNGGLLAPLFRPIVKDNFTSPNLGMYKPYLFIYTSIRTRRNESCTK